VGVWLLYGKVVVVRSQLLSPLYPFQNMYRMATEVDQTCGRILNKLKEQGVLDNTLVIFTTDNGNLHGEHGLAEKCKIDGV